MTADSIKADILASLRADFKEIIREELKTALAEDIQRLKAELADDTKTLREEMEKMETGIEDMDSGLSLWSDEVTSFCDTVSGLQKEVVTLRDKCEDMEGRIRRCNIQIAGRNEQPNSAVAKALKTILQLGRDIKVDRSHRVLTTRDSPRDRQQPWVIIAKLHYGEDAVKILQKARENAPLHYNGQRISIFPDYTASVTKARATFTDVRKILRGQTEIRYGLFFLAWFRITNWEDTKEFVDH